MFYFKLNYIKMSLYMYYVIITKYFKNLILRKCIKWFQIPAFIKNLHNLSPLPCFLSSGLRVWRCIFFNKKLNVSERAVLWNKDLLF